MADSDEQDAREPISNRDRFDKSKRNLLWASSLLFLLAVGFVDSKTIESPFYSIKLSFDKRFIVWCLVAVIFYFYIGFKHDSSFVKISNSEAAKNNEELELTDSINKSSRNLIAKISEIETSMDGILLNINQLSEISRSPEHKIKEKLPGNVREVNELYSSVDALYNRFEQDFEQRVNFKQQIDIALLYECHRQFRVGLRNDVGKTWANFVTGRNLPEGVELAFYLKNNSEIEENIKEISDKFEGQMKIFAAEVRSNSEMFVRLSNKITKSSKNMLSYYEILVPTVFSFTSIFVGLTGAYCENLSKLIFSILFP